MLWLLVLFVMQKTAYEIRSSDWRSDVCSSVLAGLSGGADVILIPEIPFSIVRVTEHIRSRQQVGQPDSIVVVSEGAKPKGGHQIGSPSCRGRVGRHVWISVGGDDIQKINK